MSQLRSIAERLRSDNENERATAVSMIERKTGLSITEVIQRGARSHLRGDPQKWVLEHISTKTGDRMILAVGREIAALKTSWGDIVEAGCLSKQAARANADAIWPQPAEPDFSDAWNAAFGDFMQTAGAEMWKHAYSEGVLDEDDINGIYNSVKKAREEMKAKAFTRVGRNDLPLHATGTPHITRKGTAKTGNAYAVVNFRRMTGPGGENIAPMCEFIAFGDEWVSRIQRAEEEEASVSVTFGADRSPNRHVVINDAL